MEESKLKPCPFCGGYAIIIHPSNEDHFGYLHSAACCTEEGCRGEQFDTWYGTEEEAIESWNTRYEQTCKWWFDCDYDESVGIWTTECGVELPYGDYDKPKFCPNCGAKIIDGEK